MRLMPMSKRAAIAALSLTLSAVGCTFHSSAFLFRSVNKQDIDSASVYYALPDPNPAKAGRWYTFECDSVMIEKVRGDVSRLIDRIRALSDSSIHVFGQVTDSTRDFRDTNYLAVRFVVNEHELWYVRSRWYTFFRRSNCYWGMPLGKSVRYADEVGFDDQETYTLLKHLVNRLIERRNIQMLADPLPLVP